MDITDIIAIMGTWYGVLISKRLNDEPIPDVNEFYDFDIIEECGYYHVVDDSRRQIHFGLCPLCCGEIDDDIYELKYNSYTIFVQKIVS